MVVVLAGGVSLCVLARHASRPTLSGVEERLVGEWQTAHGNVDTIIELRADRTVSVAQEIQLALPGDRVCRVGPVTTTGRWRVEAGRLLLETSSAEFTTPSWRKVRRFVRTHQWPGDGALHRDWGLGLVQRDRFDFIDRGSGERGHAVKQSAAVAAVAVAPPAAREFFVVAVD